MSKPGEYELPDLPEPYTYSEITGIPLNSYNEVEEYGKSCAAAVEKAHAERNCGNCGNAGKSACPFPRFMDWYNNQKEFAEIGLKCNDWKSKEADNADA